VVEEISPEFEVGVGVVVFHSREADDEPTQQDTEGDPDVRPASP
jgi:hypothetical protein